MDALLILLPVIAILIVVYIMMKDFTKQNTKQLDYLRNEQHVQIMKMELEKKSNSEKISIPLKFQAYERMALFLERINPTNLLTRVMNPKMRVSTLHSSLLATIREEYEHNMSQQLYISDNSWGLVKTAKEEVVRLINSSAAKFNSEDNANVFAQEIITNGFNNNNNPIEKALKGLKEDIRENFS
ncbi:MAG: hypothetical protein HQ521_11670 [Bacteroidetes bacterium]|nr:hypothetical protein [Bacteroidota bacterium]